MLKNVLCHSSTFNGVRQSITVFMSSISGVVSASNLSLLFIRNSKMNSKKFILVIQKFLFIFGGSATSGTNLLSSLKTLMALAKISSTLALVKHLVAALAIVVRKHGTTGTSGMQRIAYERGEFRRVMVYSQSDVVRFCCPLWMANVISYSKFFPLCYVGSEIQMNGS